MHFTGKTLCHYARLMRWPNLLIIIITMILVRYGLLVPLLQHLPGKLEGRDVFVPGLSLKMAGWQFLLLILSTVLITAAGYVINDYFDTRTDQVNRPHRVIVGKEISRRKAMSLHMTLNILGVLIGVALAVAIGFSFLGFIFFVVAGLLWFYSTSYKRQFLIGNLLVAFLTALVPFMVVLFEVPLLNKAYSTYLSGFEASWRLLIIWVGAFSVFAFLLTLIREIIKDMEDFEGDWSFGRMSLPVVLGMDTTRYIVIALTLLTLFLIGFVWYRFLGDTGTLLYGLFLIVLPLVWLVVKMFRARRPTDYHQASSLAKWIMLAGVLFIAFVRLMINALFQ